MLTNYNPYIAVLMSDYGNYIPRIWFLHPRNPAGGDWTPIGTYDQAYVIHQPYYNYDSLAYVAGSNLLQAGDFQGRSVRVGPPFIGRVRGNLQPKVVAAMPPMMADLITNPSGGSPYVRNISANPVNFYNKFTATSSQSNQSSSEETTSTTEAKGASTGSKIGYAWPGVSGEINIKASADNTWSETTSKTYNTYSQTSFNVAIQTYLQDIVFYTSNNYNLYYYPVIGATVEQEPAFVEFSGPTYTNNSYNGGSTSWYQPVMEPFQLFSYPRTQSQLELSLGELLEQLSTTGVVFSTDNGSGGSYSTTWTGERTEGSVTASTNEVKYAGSVTASFGTQDWNKLVGFGARVSVTASYSKSTSNKSNVLEVTKLGASTGIGGNLPSAFPDPNVYKYDFFPVIYGQYPEVNELEVETAGANVSTNGIVFGEFLADASGSDAGSFWKGPASPYNQPGKIDIALNHPDRWFFEAKSYNSTTSAPPECLAKAAGDTAYVCSYAYRPKTDGDLWGDLFYKMRGLFITADVPSGPQLAQTTAGKIVYLQARVYNYSFQRMQPGQTLQVRFYRQTLNIADNTLTGAAVLLNPGNAEIVTDQSGNPVLIPAYGDEAPNWTIAQTSFDTTGLDGQHFVFWVVAWAQDQTGALVPEVDYHGLQNVPGTLQHVYDAPLQTVNVQYPSNPTASGRTSFTNNVGFYRQDFYVAPAVTSGVVTTVSSPAPRARLRIANVTAVPMIGASNALLVSADITASGASADGVMVHVVDLSQTPARPFDMDLIQPSASVGAGD